MQTKCLKFLKNQESQKHFKIIQKNKTQNMKIIKN